MNEVFTWAGGGKEFFKNLDIWYENLSTAGSTLYHLDKSKYVPIQGAIAQSIVMVGGVIISAIPFFIIVASSLAIQIVVMLAPFMILSLLFPITKKTFSNWLEQFMQLVFVVLIISLLQKGFNAKIAEFSTDALKIVNNGGKLDVLATSMQMLIMCIIFGGLLYSSVPIARSITGVWHNMGIGKGGI